MEQSKKKQLTGVLIAGMALLACVFALHGSLLTRTIDFYGLTDASQGMPSAMTSAGGFIALISSLFLSGRISKLTLLKCGIGICAVFLFILPWMSGSGIFIAVWLGIGIGLGYLDMLLSSCMSDLYQGKSARRMMCILHLTYGMAYVTAPVVYSFVLKQMENKAVLWNRLYFYVAGFGLILLLILIFITRNISPEKGGVASLESSLSGRLISEMMHVKKGVLPKMMLAMFFHGIFMSGITTWINRYMEVDLQAGFGAYALSFLFFGVMISTLVMLSFYLGQAIGPAMTGRLESAFNLQTGIGVCAVFIILASGCCISARIKNADSKNQRG